MQRTSEDKPLLLSNLLQRYFDLEARHMYTPLNSRQLAIVYNNLASMHYIGIEKQKRGVYDLGLQREVFLEMDRDDIVFAMRDDEVAIKVFGREFFSK